MKRSISAFLAVGAASVASAVTFDVRNDFSLAAGNPNGAWSYGSRTTALGAGINLFTNTYTAGGFSLWVGNSTPTDPNAGLSNGQYGIPAGDFRLHPGFVGSGEEYVVTRLTLGQGLYNLNGAFFEGDSGIVDTYVLINGALYDQGTKNNPFGGQIYLGGATNTIEFVVGPAGNYGSDSTGLRASVSSVPGPGALATFGLSALGVARRRRRAR